MITSKIILIQDYDYTEATPVSPRLFSSPFEGDAVPYVHSQDFIQQIELWKPLPLSSPDAPDYPASYLIEETPLQSAGPRLVRWTRTYSQIPRSRFESESFAWQMPGIAVVPTTGVLFIDNANSKNIGGGLTQITTTEIHGLQGPPKPSAVQITYTVKEVGLEQTVSIIRTVRSVGPKVFTVDVIPAEHPFYLSCVGIDAIGRDPVTRTVNASVHYDYYLPGVPGQVDVPQRIPIIQQLIIRDEATGKDTNIFSDTTKPSKESWMELVAAGAQIVPEASTFKRWRGGIFERITRYVIAQ